MRFFHLQRNVPGLAVRQGVRPCGRVRIPGHRGRAVYVGQRCADDLGLASPGYPSPGRKGRTGNLRSALAAGQDQRLPSDSPDADVRRKTAAYLGELARFCADLGGKVMVFGSPKQRDLLPGVSREDGMKHAAEVIKAALPIFEKTNVTLALEPLAAKRNQLHELLRRGSRVGRKGRRSSLPPPVGLQGDGARADADPRADPQVRQDARPFPRQRTPICKDPASAKSISCRSSRRCATSTSRAGSPSRCSTIRRESTPSRGRAFST